MMSSAVMIPDQPSPSTSRSPSPLPSAPEQISQRQSPAPTSQPQSLKRRQSSPDTNSNKKARHVSPRSPTSNTMSPPPHGLSQVQQHAQAQRKPALSSGLANEEKKRGQRLFGALLGTLAPPRNGAGNGLKSSSRKTSANGAADKVPAASLAARRSEIEKRAQDRLRREREDREEEVRRRREEIDRARRVEQQSWDKQGREIRWRNMRATAGFLKTKTQPVLYYKPWELRPEEEDRIAAQLREVDESISREKDEWTQREGQELQDSQPVQDNDVQMDLDKQVDEIQSQPSGHNPSNDPSQSRGRSDDNGSNSAQKSMENGSEEQSKQDVSMTDTNGITGLESDNAIPVEKEGRATTATVTPNGTQLIAKSTFSSPSLPANDDDRKETNGTTTAAAATAAATAHRDKNSHDRDNQDGVTSSNASASSETGEESRPETGSKTSNDQERHNHNHHHNNHHHRNHSLDSSTNHNDEELVEGQEDDVIY